MENNQILSTENDTKFVTSGECVSILQIEDITDENFNYDGYQVVRREFFAHIFEPSITFNVFGINDKSNRYMQKQLTLEELHCFTWMNLNK